MKNIRYYTTSTLKIQSIFHAGDTLNIDCYKMCDDECKAVQKLKLTL